MCVRRQIGGNSRQENFSWLEEVSQEVNEQPRGFFTEEDNITGKAIQVALASLEKRTREDIPSPSGACPGSLQQTFSYFYRPIPALRRLIDRFTFREGGCDRFLFREIVEEIELRVTGNVSHSKDSREAYISLIRKVRNGGNCTAEAKKAAYNLFFLPHFFPIIKRHALSQLPELGGVHSVETFANAYKILQARLPVPHVEIENSPPFDPILLGNIPFSWRRITLNEGSDCLLLRMPSATTDIVTEEGIPFYVDIPYQPPPRVTDIAITEEFQYYIAARRDREERHLYVNLQTLLGGPESLRSQALIEFGQRSDGSCLVVCLDKNSPFYRQRTTPETQSTDVFYNQLASSFHSGLYSWPHGISVLDLTSILESAMTAVRNRYDFGDDLSRNRRQVLIDLVHTEIIHHLLQYYKPVATNISCKNCIDRGIAQQMELIATTQAEEEFFSEDNLAITFGPSYLVSNRPMQAERFSRLTEVLDVIFKNKR